MININIHNDNLTSIKEVKNDFSGKLLILDVIEKIYSNAKFIFVEFNRNHYDTVSMIRFLKEKNIHYEIKNLKISKKCFKISFSIDIKEFYHKDMEIITSLWFAYEQPLVYFYVFEEEFMKKISTKTKRRLSWDEICKDDTVYILFKSSEENVLWIGKNNSLPGIFSESEKKGN